MGDQAKHPDEQLARLAISNQDIPKIYANGFVVGLTQADVFVVLQSGLDAVAVLQLSFNTAKTLGISLNQTINDLEQQTGKTFLTVQEVGKVLKQSSNELATASERGERHDNTGD